MDCESRCLCLHLLSSFVIAFMISLYCCFGKRWCFDLGHLTRGIDLVFITSTSMSNDLFVL